MEHEEDTAFPLLFTVLRPGIGKYWLTPAEAEELKAELEFIGMVPKPGLNPDTLARLVDFLRDLLEVVYAAIEEGQPIVCY